MLSIIKLQGKDFFEMMIHKIAKLYVSHFYACTFLVILAVS